jgi:hypothetical protein
MTDIVGKGLSIREALKDMWREYAEVVFSCKL